ENPGPPLQVSSDAADTLGMLAGAPATLNVTALRREEAAQPVPTEATTAADADAGLETAVFEAAPAIAAAPLDDTPPAAGASEPVMAGLDDLPPAGPPSDLGLDPAALVSAAAAAMQGMQPPAGAVSPAPAPATGPAPAAAASALDRPFIQLGIFSVEANAQSLADDMNTKGLPARVLAQQSQGRSFWRVLVGPAQSTTERATLMTRVQAEGFTDAYFVRN
ncbi:MAG: SPOR domain-containing protein, partial [Rubellimicrobium sp.]|nr:SPOR domain-containing protein [Rubellimicrobium sp.]